MTHPRLADVLSAAGVPDLTEILGERLGPLELDTVLLEVHRQRAGRMTPAHLLTNYERDLHSRPARASALRLAAMDRLAFSLAAPAFELLDLSPLCPIGTVSTLAPVDPAAAWGAGAGHEVVSDCAIVLALESALRRRAALSGNTPGLGCVRLCASHRELHVPFSAPLRGEALSRVLALCTAGEDEGGFLFAAASLKEQVGIHLGVLEGLREEGCQIGLISTTFSHQPVAGVDEMLRCEVMRPLGKNFPQVQMRIAGHQAPARGGYAPIAFSITVEDRAEVAHEIGLGGFTDWTRHLLGRVAEQLLVSKLATERLAEVFGG